MRLCDYDWEMGISYNGSRICEVCGAKRNKFGLNECNGAMSTEGATQSWQHGIGYTN